MRRVSPLSLGLLTATTPPPEWTTARYWLPCPLPVNVAETSWSPLEVRSIVEVLAATPSLIALDTRCRPPEPAFTCIVAENSDASGSRTATPSLAGLDRLLTVSEVLPFWLNVAAPSAQCWLP